MTQLGESVSVAAPFKDAKDPQGSYFFRFKLLDENGKPITNVLYKTVKSGASAKPLHIADGKTLTNGATGIVSTKKDEEIDFYIVWAKLKVNKGFLKS